MVKQAVVVRAVIDSRLLRDFLIFDGMYRRRGWVSPVIFASLLTAFACACFLLQAFAGGQAVMLGCVLLFVGLGLPSVFFWAFFRSIKGQTKAHGLDTPRHAYTLTLESEGVDITNPAGERARYGWDGMYAAYRAEGCSYLFVTDVKAFLLPDAATDTEALWALFAETLPPEKLRDCRGAKPWGIGK